MNDFLLLILNAYLGWYYVTNEVTKYSWTFCIDYLSTRLHWRHWLSFIVPFGKLIPLFVKSLLIMADLGPICWTWPTLRMTLVQKVLVASVILVLSIALYFFNLELTLLFLNFHSAWDYSAWVRIYALYLEERLECFRVLKYDVETDPPVCNLMQAYFSYLLHFQKVFKSHFHLYICSGPCNYMLMSWHKILPCNTPYLWKRERASSVLI